MAPRSISVLKFVGTVSLGLLTGLSYTLSAITIPTLLALPSASSAALTFTHITTRCLTDLRIWTGVATSSFLLAYALSPRYARHPYLLWTSLLVAGSELTDVFLSNAAHKNPALTRQVKAKREREGKSKMEASYEVLGDEARSEGTSASDAEDESVNGEEVRAAMVEVQRSQMVRGAMAAVAFAMGVVGIWGDGA